MDRRRVVMTGLGAITPIGHERDGLLQGILMAKSGVQRITRFDSTPFASQIAAEVRDFDPLDYFEKRELRRLDRYAQFSLVSARMATRDAKLNLEKEDLWRIGVYIGSALGGVAFGEDQHTSFIKSGIRSVSPILALSIFGGAGSCNIAIDLDLKGPNIANSNSCASGTVAIGEAFRLIQYGYADLMLAGGVEAPLAPLSFGAFSLIRALSTYNEHPEKASRPFDRERDGFVMGEGAAFLVLEELTHALERGADIYAEVIGYSLTNDAYHMTAPLPNGESAARAISLALQDAHLTPSDINYINAHGSSTPLNDKTETLAIKKIFGERAYTIPVSATKGMHGHSLGATGAIEAAICLLALRYHYLPPTINYEHPDPECNLDYIPNIGRNIEVDRILSNSFGFGGINSCLVLGRYEG
ncbi:MAG: beta-ketoacyl-ACP synthase II [Candidatus Tectomicrobia bacterium]|nr:beta-ketoacyl-ACP synthase II [Candidatus Tectomicrobia bacterium]